MREELGVEVCEVEEETVGAARQAQEVEVSARVTAGVHRRLTTVL